MDLNGRAGKTFTQLNLFVPHFVKLDTIMTAILRLRNEDGKYILILLHSASLVLRAGNNNN